ncbi:unnamed protein product [Polarella glacialis]|uniref:Uncharacterized protein n=1 Tax=Polarella glacialis TaxID=89957 RepID=A0A813H9F8_POLGL|nr:unnamed protein product [Polarella glacialis]
MVNWLMSLLILLLLMLLLLLIVVSGRSAAYSQDNGNCWLQSRTNGKNHVNDLMAETCQIFCFTSSYRQWIQILRFSCRAILVPYVVVAVVVVLLLLLLLWLL